MKLDFGTGQLIDAKAQLDELIRADYEDSLYLFLRDAWRHIDSSPWRDSWAIEAVAEHLQAVVDGDIRRLLINIPPRMGKQVADDTPVFTTQGWKMHGDLRPGDEVFHPSGRAVRVLAVSEKTPSDVRVEFFDGSVIYCHQNHEWTLFNRMCRRWETVEAGQFLKPRRGRWGLTSGRIKVASSGGRALHQLPEVSALQFPEARFMLPPYVLGAWLGDGSTGKACITHAASDQPIIDRIASLGFAPGAVWTHKDTGVLTTSFGEGKGRGACPMVLGLRAFGVIHNKHIPQPYMRASIAQRLELMAGLIDTDGTVDRVSRCTFTTVSRRLADDVAELARGLGWRASITQYEPRLSSSGIQGVRPYWAVSFQPDMEIPTALPRKKIKRLAPKRRIGLKSVTHDPCGKIGHCIQVDAPDGLYLVGRNLTPTHNSSICSVCLPAWAWAQPTRSPTSGPGVQFLHASYANQLALRDSVKCRRLIESPWYQNMWGHRFALNEDQNTKHRFSNDKGGERLITSVGAAVTGEGGNCFIAGTRVSCPGGSLSIEDIREGHPVFCFDHSRGGVVISRVVAVKRRLAGNLYALRSASGNSITCTGDHPVFSPGRGYVAASGMGRGDALLIEGGARYHPSPPVRQLRSVGGQAALRGKEGAQAGKPRQLLLQDLQSGPSRDQTRAALRGLRPASKESPQSILLGHMPGDGEALASKNASLPEVRRAIRHEGRLRWAKKLAHVLLGGLRRRGSRGSHAGPGEQQLQGKLEIFQPLSGDAGGCPGARRLEVLGLRQRGENGQPGCDVGVVAAHPPHRPHPVEQRAGEPDHALPELPREASRWHTSFVEHVSAYGDGEVWVYDIQVEGHSNFFANGILVHNCIIIDDPNAANEAFSEATIQSTIDWWDQTMSTRLNDSSTGAYIVIQQRLAENDLSGHILENEGEEWTHLCLPMSFEPERSFVTVLGWEDPRTEPGELLAPERFDDAEVKRLERRLGPYGACGQLQQRPEPAGGGIIKREWWQLWEEASFPPMDFILASLDTAYTEKEINDPSAMTIWGVFTEPGRAQTTRVMSPDGGLAYDDRAYLDGAPQVMLMYAWTERLELHALVTKAAEICKKMKVDKLLVENKASGISVSQELKRLYSREKFAVQLSDPKSTDKMSRLYSVQHIFSEGMVFAPDKKWAEMVMTQVGQFPKGKHDDLVDTVSQAIRHLRDINLLTMGPERLQDIEDSKVYPGNSEMPLYPV